MINDIFVVYGINKLEKKKFKKIKNRTFFNKPRGGLWASPLHSKKSWREWCLEENFNISDLDKYCMFRLKKDSKIYTITNGNDLESCPKTIKYEITPTHINKFIDFEGLRKMGYDGIFASAIGVCITSAPSYYAYESMDLYGWDVESLLLFNYDCIVPVSPYRRIKINGDYRKRIIILSTLKNTIVDGGIHKDNLVWKYDKVPSTWVIKGNMFKSKKAFIREAIRLQKLISDDPESKFTIK